VAMAWKDGVVGAVIHKANTLQVGEYLAQRRELTERARAPAYVRETLPRDFYAEQPGHVTRSMLQCDHNAAAGRGSRGGSISDRVCPLRENPASTDMTMTLSSDPACGPEPSGLILKRFARASFASREGV